MRSRSPCQAPSFGRGCTARAYSKDVAPDRRTFRTVFRDTFSSRTISLIGLPLTRCSRLIRPIVSTTSIPATRSASQAGQLAHHCKKGGKVGRRSPLYRGQSSTPDHSLEQEFNSLHAQREACEAFIRSQRHEGWTYLPQPYDDGGRSGGNLERPALQQLLADIRDGKVDVVVVVVVVYKIDRL